MKLLLLATVLLIGCSDKPEPTAPVRFAALSMSSATEDNILPNHSRPAPPIEEQGVPYYPALRVDRIYIGTGLVLRAGDGQRYSDGRLEIRGLGDNSAEVGLWPGQTRGLAGANGRILTQISQYSHCYKCGGARTSWSINTTGDGQYVMYDTDYYPNGYNMPVYFAQGTADNFDGTSGPINYHNSMFWNHSDEIYLPDGRRVNLMEAIAAVVRHYPTEVGVR